MNENDRNAMFSHDSDEWATPEKIYAELDAEFHFDLDPCATAENHKCKRYFDKQIDGLVQTWGGGVAFSAIHRIHKSANGWLSAFTNHGRITRWLLC